MRYIKFLFKLRSIGEDCWVIKRQRYISSDLILGDYSFIGADCTIYPKVIIGRFALLAPGVSIVGADHRFCVVGTPICFSGRDNIEPTIIGDDVWIGQGSIIMVGVSVGRGAIIAAGSVVTKNVPECVIVGGNPAHFIRNRFEDAMSIDLHFSTLSSIQKAGEYTKDLL